MGFFGLWVFLFGFMGVMYCVFFCAFIYALRLVFSFVVVLFVQILPKVKSSSFAVQDVSLSFRFYLFYPFFVFPEVATTP